YDYGPGPYARPLTTVRFLWDDERASPPRQFLVDPKVPVVTTRFATARDSLTVQTFSLAPGMHVQPADQPAKNVYREGGYNGAWGWTSASADVDPAFRSVAWGTNRPIRYRAQVDPGARKRVVMGFVE